MKLKLSLNWQGVSVKVFNSSNNIINEFPSIRAAAKYFNLNIRYVRKYLDKNETYKGFTFRSHFKNNDRIGVFDFNYKLIQVLNSGMKLSKLYNIPKSTVYRYIESGKLYKKKYYFKKINK